MYRDLALTPSDRQWLRSNHLRYDITAIISRDICGERVKTKGHYHPGLPSGTGYPEMYEVLMGHAHYLLQKRNLSDVLLVDAQEKDIEYERKRGAAYYELSDGTFKKNPAYHAVPDLRIINAGKLRGRLHIPEGGMYELIGTDRLGFLNHPEYAADLFREALKG